MSISVTMKASMDARKTLGFDYKDGAAWQITVWQCPPDNGGGVSNGPQHNMIA